MANNEVHDGPGNPGRRRFLTATTVVVGAVGAGFAAVPFIKSWNPSARAKVAGGPVTVNVANLVAGQILGGDVAWRGQPVYVIKRTPKMLEMLPQMDALVADPKSQNIDQQPKYAQNEHRSLKPDVLVLIGVCTHLGCAPELHSEVKPEPFDPDWKGGFFCPCHKSKYDMAGRVLKSQPAPANLPVPPYHFEGDSLVIGIDPPGAA
ncbi:ubiquinol-cytochrome c reductase iron-sulfur subunit [Solilutibacter silvestris]|uniref:Ubiquinol-cytochrome c reductase iron-sulfur subunit n=1 Tax=Solilutibacter silvestris TaxID=1645665 RepID=A0A2K1Q330_9GAMM|nr:ubiquinol-cytochrome c reductase iron-sulfur subunit [Lysobacter silvestris]PNS09445.1 ubiquinol-cytochrome c reductase, iron-sulfur subunit [Lysobacter silvestris]